MKTKLITILLIAFIGLFLHAQDPIYIIPKEQRSLIEKAAKCLKEKQTDCNSYFEQALQVSKDGENDSILAQTYFEICNVLDFVGKGEDHIAYAKRGLHLNGKNHPLVTNRLLRELGYAYSKAGKVDSLIPIYNKAIYWAEFANDSSEIAISRIRLASAYKRIGNIKKSIELLLDTRVYVKASNDIHRESGLLFTLANSYSSNKDDELAISNYLEAAKGFLEVEDDRMYAASLVNMSLVANEIGKHKLALEKLPEAIRIFEKKEPNSALYGKTYLGHAHFLNGDIEKAIAIHNECIKESIRIDNKLIENRNRKYLAQVYLDSNEHALALPETTIVYKNEKERGISDAYLNALKLHAEALTLNNKTSDAVNVYQEYISTKDSIFTIEKEKEIANMRERYETEKKEAQIVLLEKDVSLSKTQKTLYGIGMVSFLTISGLLYFGFKQRIKKNKIEREKQEEIYKQEIAFKKKELASQTLHLVQKSTFIQELKENLEKIKKSPELFKLEFRRLVMLLKKESAEDKDWEVFKSYFSEVHNNFDHKIKAISEDVTEKEIRLASFLRMNLSTKEIASMLNVLPDSVLKSKYRLKKKLKLDKADDLTQFLNTL
ncbi:tetratricopeptide repeat protein [Psychroserpens mesophilus]|uniref:tetratricopeptide repeat protein n=1 Tax=Psychroserpens mesophilus TaxID=325473 RepID=UPI003D649D81